MYNKKGRDVAERVGSSQAEGDRPFIDIEGVQGQSRQRHGSIYHGENIRRWTVQYRYGADETFFEGRAQAGPPAMVASPKGPKWWWRTHFSFVAAAACVCARVRARHGGADDDDGLLLFLR